MTVTTNRARRDAGSITLELTILAPAVLALLGLVIVAGRVEIAGGAVEQASAAAAREASLARSPDAARQAATQAALDNLNGQDLHCTDLVVVIDAAGFAVPVGSPAYVSARVSCTVELGDISVPGMPGSRTLTAETQSTLDRYRSR
jgi:hypothetical protein